MSLVSSLLQAIVRVDGEALVMHAGDKPYVVSPTGQVDLASRGLTLEAVNGIVAQLLPIEPQNALDEFGAVQHELAPMTCGWKSAVAACPRTITFPKSSLCPLRLTPSRLSRPSRMRRWRARWTR